MTAAPRRARGLTLVELLLALSLTALAGLGTASMLAMIGQSTQADREGRSVVMRAHAVHSRVAAYLEPALCVLQQDQQRGGLAVWLMDQSGPGMVNLTEIRVFWYDPQAKALTTERVAFPEAWPQAAKDAADVTVPANSDFLALVQAQRALGYTVTQEIGREVWSAQWSFDAGAAQGLPNAKRVLFTGQIGINQTAAAGLLVATGLPNQRKPTQ